MSARSGSHAFGVNGNNNNNNDDDDDDADWGAGWGAMDATPQAAAKPAAQANYNPESFFEQLGVPASSSTTTTTTSSATGGAAPRAKSGGGMKLGGVRAPRESRIGMPKEPRGSVGARKPAGAAGVMSSTPAAGMSTAPAGQLTVETTGSFELPSMNSTSPINQSPMGKRNEAKRGADGWDDWNNSDW
jgi:hypothetical protein